MERVAANLTVMAARGELLSDLRLIHDLESNSLSEIKTTVEERIAINSINLLGVSKSSFLPVDEETNKLIARLQRFEFKTKSEIITEARERLSAAIAQGQEGSEHNK